MKYSNSRWREKKHTQRNNSWTNKIGAINRFNEKFEVIMNHVHLRWTKSVSVFVCMYTKKIRKFALGLLSIRCSCSVFFCTCHSTTIFTYITFKWAVFFPRKFLNKEHGIWCKFVTFFWVHHLLMFYPCIAQTTRTVFFIYLFYFFRTDSATCFFLFFFFLFFSPLNFGTHTKKKLNNSKFV